jgi:metallo-beta-lactamase family protein
MEIKVLGAAREVTGSCYSLVSGEDNILIDCGMFQGGKDLERLNYEKFGFSPRKYKALLLTHAHLDHCGRIPLLVKNGFRGKIYCTDATKALAFIIMADSAKIAEEDTKNENKRRAMENLPPRKPIYSPADVNEAIKLFITVKYGENLRVSKNIYAKYYDAGHILGSASIQVSVKEENKEKVVVFSGDLGQENSILVRNGTPIQKADYVFMESTYGDRLHEPIDKRKMELARIINETYKRGGKLMIPSFAVERTQELLFYIGQFMDDGTIPRMPVFLDSPMAIKSTDVFRKFMKYFNEDVQERFKETNDVFGFPELTLTRSREESKEINGVSNPCIIIAGNGMCSAGRIKHHIANNIEDPKNTLLFVGFQVDGTLGYWIKKGEKSIHLLGREVQVKSKIEVIEGFSAHADRVGLQKWLKNYSSKPKKVFIIHGDEDQQVALSKTLAKDKYESYIPSLGEEIKI